MRGELLRAVKQAASVTSHHVALVQSKDVNPVGNIIGADPLRCPAHSLAVAHQHGDHTGEATAPSMTAQVSTTEPGYQARGPVRKRRRVGGADMWIVK
jgi:hypothetical protein